MLIYKELSHNEDIELNQRLARAARWSIHKDDGLIKLAGGEFEIDGDDWHATPFTTDERCVFAAGDALQVHGWHLGTIVLPDRTVGVMAHVYLPDGGHWEHAGKTRAEAMGRALGRLLDERRAGA